MKIYHIIKTPTLFYRIERNGVGHFRWNERSHCEYYDLHYNMTGMSSRFAEIYPKNDWESLQNSVKNWFCGYRFARSIHDFNTPSCLRRLYKAGYKIKQIAAKYCLIFPKQIFFKKSQIVSSKDLSLKKFSQLYKGLSSASF